MKKIYLDHNIYIFSLENERLRNSLIELKNTFQVFYSPAHVEEIFKAYMDNKDTYETIKQDLLDIISQVTNNQEVLPSDTLVNVKESPLKCYKRVEGTDTRNRVASDSEKRFDIDAINRHALVGKDKKYCNLSNVLPEKIWNEPIFKNYIQLLNDYSYRWIEKYNNSLDVLILLLFGIDKRIPNDFRFDKGNYSALKNSHVQLALTIEILFRVLNYMGYCSEKKVKTSISGTHDVTHAIYATATDYIVTADKNFAKKCSAVYSFLNADTKVVLCKPQEINSFFDNKLYSILCGNENKDKYLIG